MKKQYEIPEHTAEIFAKADFLAEEAVKVACKGNIAVKKEELYTTLYGLFINRYLNKFERTE